MTAPVPARVGVIGGGRMGAGIAHAFLLAGSTATVLERDDAAAAAAGEAVRRSLAASVERGTAAAPLPELASRLRTTSDPALLADADLVIEAVPEDLDLKRSMLQRIERVLQPAAWLASNTSSISIDLLAASLERPERLCGLHFFNPVPSSSLVEVVRGDRTDEALIAAARDWVAGIGKVPVVVRDSPGFASSRLGVVVALEAIRMLEEGVASADDIDTAMVLGYRFPIGPLHLTDLIGLDVRLGIAEYLEGALGERFRPPRLLRDLVAAGWLGRKTGQGFFSWEN